MRYSNRAKSTPDQLVRQVQRGTRLSGGLQNFGQRPMFSDPFDEESYTKPPSLGLGPEEQLPVEEPLDWSPGSEEERARYRHIQDNLTRDEQHVQLGDGSLGGLSDVTLGGLTINDLLAYNGSVWTAQNASEAGLAEDDHTHNASDITLGTLALARGGTNASLLGIDGELIQMASDGSALEGSGSTPADFAEASHTHVPGDIVGGFWDLDVGGTNADLSGGAVNSELIRMNAAGTALEGSGSTAADFAASSHTHTAGDITSVIGLDIGGTAADLSGGGLNSEFIRMNAGGTALEGSGSTVSDFAAAAHVHAADDITSGLLALARGGTNAALSGIDGELIQMASGGAALEGSGVVVSTLAPLDDPTFTTGINLPDDVPINFGDDDDWVMDFDSSSSQLHLKNTTGQTFYIQSTNIDLDPGDVSGVWINVSTNDLGPGNLAGVEIDVAAVTTGTQLGDVYGCKVDLRAGVGGQSLNGDVVAGLFQTFPSTAAATPHFYGEWIGVRGRVYNDGNCTPDATTVIGGDFPIELGKISTTDAIGVRIPTITVGTGDANNTYGVKVGEQTIGNKNYALYLEGTGAIHFDGDIPKVWSSDSTKLNLQADNYLFADENGNEILALDGASSAVCYLKVTNGASGAGVIMEALGETNTDLNMNLSNAGNLWVNKTSGISPNVFSVQANHRSMLRGVTYNDADNIAVQFQGYRARGSQASPTAVVNGDFLLGFISSGRDSGGTTQYAGRVMFTVDGAVSSGAVPTEISFQTGSNIGNITEALVVDSSQNVSIPAGDLDVDGSIETDDKFICNGSGGITTTHNGGSYVGGILVATLP